MVTQTTSASDRRIELVADNNDNGPHWARPPINGELEGLKRGFLYRLMEEGVIETVSLKRPGSRHGVRLIYLPSLRAYLQRQLELQNPGDGGAKSSPSFAGLAHPQTTVALAQETNPN